MIAALTIPTASVWRLGCFKLEADVDAQRLTLFGGLKRWPSHKIASVDAYYACKAARWILGKFPNHAAPERPGPEESPE